MKRFHIALSTGDLDASIKDYSLRLGKAPDVVVQDEYALWKTETLNVSVRKDASVLNGQLRHLGWEDSAAEKFSEEVDVNGIVWEHFSEEQQLAEIKGLWGDK